MAEIVQGRPAQKQRAKGFHPWLWLSLWLFGSRVRSDAG